MTFLRPLVDGSKEGFSSSGDSFDIQSDCSLTLPSYSPFSTELSASATNPHQIMTVGQSGLESTFLSRQVSSPYHQQTLQARCASMIHAFQSSLDEMHREQISYPSQQSDNEDSFAEHGASKDKNRELEIEHKTIDCDDEEYIEDSFRSVSNHDVDNDGDTLLHLAVLHTVTHLSRVVRALRLQQQVNLPNRLFQTPLHLAVLTANTDAVSLLLELGASLASQDCHGNTPLHMACERKDFRTLLTLLRVPEKCQKNANTSRGTDCDVVTPNDVKHSLSILNYEGLTCLHIAVIQGQLDLVRLLIEKGADVNMGDGKSGRTPLHFAIESCSPTQSSIISLLLTHPQLVIDASTFAHQTALKLARGRHRQDLVDLLYQHGAECSENTSSSSGDSFSEQEMEEDIHFPFDDICLAGQPIILTGSRNTNGDG